MRVNDTIAARRNGVREVVECPSRMRQGKEGQFSSINLL
jgi:hypothetical protein